MKHIRFHYDMSKEFNVYNIVIKKTTIYCSKCLLKAKYDVNMVVFVNRFESSMELYSRKIKKSYECIPPYCFYQTKECAFVRVQRPDERKREDFFPLCYVAYNAKTT